MSSSAFAGKWVAVTWEFVWRFVMSILFCWWLGMMFGIEGARKKYEEVF